LHSVVTGWDTFATVAGGTAGALIGLLFVAVSIRVDVISASVELRNRAAQTLGLFGIVLVVGFAVAIPTQQRWVVGVEMIVVAVTAGAVLSWLDRRARHKRSGQAIAEVLDVVAPRTITCVLVLAAGGLLLGGVSWGMDVVAGATVIASIGGVVSAWLLLIRVGG
jgi:hypothetical protein